MKSTGEVMGSDVTLEKALYKAFEASYLHLPTFGNVLFTVADDAKVEALALAKRFYEIGYGIYATNGTAKYFKKHGIYAEIIAKIGEPALDQENIVDSIRAGRLQAVVNTMGKDRNSHNTDGMLIRRESIEQGVPLFTSLDTIAAMLKVLESRSFTTQAI